jgi:succinate dehydrogenase cytochrome b556 subunit
MLRHSVGALVRTHATRTAALTSSSLTTHLQQRRGFAGDADTYRADGAKRPTSPHVMISKWPVPAIASITNRITGCGLAVGTFSVASMAFFGSCDVASCVASFAATSPILTPIAKFTVAFPLTYHYVAGIRHFVWDSTAKGFETAEMEQSSYVVFGVSAAMTLAMAGYTVHR